MDAELLEAVRVGQYTVASFNGENPRRARKAGMQEARATLILMGWSNLMIWAVEGYLQTEVIKG